MAVESVPPVSDHILPEDLLVHIGRLAGIKAGQPLESNSHELHCCIWQQPCCQRFCSVMQV